MHLLAGFFQTIILLGAVQGFILGGLLFFSAKNRQPESAKRRLPNRLLAVLLFLISLACLKLYCVQQGWFNTVPFLRLVDAFIPLIIVMPVGPLIFFYIRSSTDPDFRLTKKDRIHFYPLLIDLVPQLTAILFILGLLTHTVKNNPGPWGSFIDNYNVYADIPRWIAATWYIWKAARYLSGLKVAQPAGPPTIGAFPQLRSPAGTQPPAQWTWLRQFIRLFQVFQGIWLIYLIPYIIPRYTDRLLDWVDWYPVYVPLAILIYWLGIKGYSMSQREFPAKKETAGQTLLTAAELELATASLKKAMETDKLYLNPTLTVSLVAEHTGMAPKHLSAILNQHLNKSFNEFVNGYRIQEIKRRLGQPESKDLTIAGLAYECGFNSQPTFQRAFKAVTGLSPREYLSKNAQIRI